MNCESVEGCIDDFYVPICWIIQQENRYIAENALNGLFVAQLNK
ncbi:MULTISPECIES: hypothetical protein [unclassified Shewanella]|jgi:hypothetical protein|nr:MULTISPECIES: hypothetical protein [unclassified Shewanella]